MLSEMKTAERVEARRLRKDEGRSIKEMTRLVGVSQSTASVWVRDIELTEAQHAALLVQDPSRNGRRNGWAANIERGRLSRRTFQLAGRRRIATYDPLYVAGCMLYWAEGAKGRNAVELSNADPEVIYLFGRFLRVCFGVPDARMRVTCHLFADHVSKQRDVEQFWLDVLGLPASCLRKSVVSNSFALITAQADESAPIRDLQARRLQHRDRSDHLRLDSGVRRLQPARLARLLARLVGQRLDRAGGRLERS
jgi:hypothetical protein